MHLKSIILISLLLSSNAFADSPNFENNSCGEEYTFDDKTLIKFDPKKKYGYITYDDDYEFPEKMGPYNVEAFTEECNQNSAFFFNAFRVLDDQGNLIFVKNWDTRALTEVLPEDEFPFYVLRDYSGGMHCCYTSYYFSKTKPYRYMGTLQSMDVKPTYEDFDGDGDAELLEFDAILTYWYTSYAGSNFIRVIYRTFREEFHPAPDLILQEMDYKDVESALEYIRGVIQGHNDWAEEQAEWAQYKKDQFLHEIATVTAQFLYADMKKEAWEFYDRIWEEMGYDYFRKLSFKREIETKIMNSMQYRSIHARSTVFENLPKITSLSKDCVYMREEGWGKDEKSEVGYTDINLRELHNEECGGDPETDVTIGFYRVYTDGKIEEFDYLDWQLRDL